MSASAQTLIWCVSLFVSISLLLYLWNRHCKKYIANLDKNMPQPMVVPLPLFAGRILPDYEVHSGTFTLSAAFADISAWGKNAIMSFGVYRREWLHSILVIKAWRPDTETAGVFQLAEKQIEVPKEWYEEYDPSHCELQGGNILVHPQLKHSDYGDGLMVFGSFVLFLIFCIGCCAAVATFLT